MIDVQPGKYIAKIIDYGIGTTKAGDPTVVVKFGWGTYSMIWNGSLKPGKAQEITIKALLRMGLKDDDKLENLADGTDSGLLDLEKDVELDVQMDTYDGKTRPKIAWINEVGGGKFKNAMAKDEFKTKLGGLDIRNNLKAIRHEMGITEGISKIPF